MRFAILPIDRDVPLPAQHQHRETFEQIGSAMKVGDSRLMSWADARSLRTTMSRKAPGSKWSIRAEGLHQYRIWRRA